MPLTYSRYLEIDQLLKLQNLFSSEKEHDEMLFIITHQVYELWFKQLLHECDRLVEVLQASELPRGQHTLKRILTILKTMVSQVDILETMTPLEFLSFRNSLESSSGFQSCQFRELEFFLGYKRAAIMSSFSQDVNSYQRLQKRLHAPSIWHYFLEFLQNNGYTVPDSVMNRNSTLPTEPNQEVQKILIEIYRHEPTISAFCEGMVDLDEGLQEWRYRHVKMVQRTIGTKMGTGNSSGADYLIQTLLTPVFPDLWNIRSEL